MNRKTIPAILILLMLTAAVAGCTASAGEDSAFPLPETPHRTDGTVVYNGLDIFEDIEFGMHADEYADIVNDRFGEGATEIVKSPAYDVDGSIMEGIEWTVARTFIYNEELDMNASLITTFINDIFNSSTVYALGYCEDYDDFRARSELLEKSVEVQTSEFKTKNISDLTRGAGSPVLEISWNNEYFDVLKDTYVWEGPHEEFDARFLYLPEYVDSDEHKNTGYLQYNTFSYDPEKVMYSEFFMGTFVDAEEYVSSGFYKAEFEKDIPEFFCGNSL
ncbi:MAG: hypothetical protein IKM61_08940 [Eubacteriaceae bacterium]|nr:hypothetical protein [Eubacteriaceae bacterium]